MANRSRSTEQVAQIPTRDLQPHPKNPRFALEKTKLAELTASIEAKGVQIPIVVRPRAAGGYEIICGHRRVEASRRCKLESVPAIVREMDDRQAIELVVTENLEHERPHPLEEAAGIDAMVATGWDLDSIASRIGLPPSLVARRRQLSKLLPGWRELREKDPDKFDRTPIGVFELIAALPNDLQRELLQRYSGSWRNFDSVADFRRFVLADKLHVLSTAPWKLDDETLEPKAGACVNCPKRTSVEPMLFEDLHEGKTKQADRCLDPQCWGTKAAAVVRNRSAELKKEHGGKVVQIIGDGTDWKKAAKLRNAGAVGSYYISYKYSTAKKGDAKAVPAIVVSGAGVGGVKWLKPASRSAGGSKKAAAKGKPTSLKERRAKLQKRRDVWIRDQVAAKLETAIAAWSKDPAVLLDLLEDEVIPLVAAFGGPDAMDSPLSVQREFSPKSRGGRPFCKAGKPAKTAWDDFVALTKRIDDAMAFVLRAVIQVMHDRIAAVAYNDMTLRLQIAECRKVCDLLKWGDWLAATEAQSAGEIPEPKSWANLKADGTPAKSAKASSKKAESKKTIAKKSSSPKKTSNNRAVKTTTASASKSRSRQQQSTAEENVDPGINQALVGREDGKCRRCDCLGELTEDGLCRHCQAQADKPKGKARSKLKGSTTSSPRRCRVCQKIESAQTSWSADDSLCYTCALHAGVPVGDKRDEADRDFFPDGACRFCGCTDDHACEGGCHWVQPTICSACANKLGMLCLDCAGGGRDTDCLGECKNCGGTGLRRCRECRTTHTVHTHWSNEPDLCYSCHLQQSPKKPRNRRKAVPA